MSADNSSVEYREVAGFPFYRVGNDGTVWSRFKRSVWKTLKPHQHPQTGHLYVTLYSGGGSHEKFTVHALVLTAFVGPCPIGLEACHEDDDKTNNRISNLRWDTRSANCLDAVRNGKARPAARSFQAVSSTQ